MCGRYALWEDESQMLRSFDVAAIVGNYLPTWNAAPGQYLPVILEREQSAQTTRSGQTLKWGLVANWAGAPRPVINARSESLVTRPTFAQSARYRRCLVPVNGYYEWSAQKQPFFFSTDGDALLALAGIYDAWRPTESSSAEAVPGHPVPTAPGPGVLQPDWLRTFAIVTRPAPPDLAQIHHRAPVVVPREHWDAWLSPQLTEPAQIGALIEAMPAPQLGFRAVSRRVGSVANNDPRLVEGAEPSSPSQPALL